MGGYLSRLPSHIGTMDDPDAGDSHEAGEFSHFPQAVPVSISGSLHQGGVYQKVTGGSVVVEISEFRKLAMHGTEIRSRVTVPPATDVASAHGTLNSHFISHFFNILLRVARD